MSVWKKWGMRLGLLSVLLAPMMFAHAGMVGTDQVLQIQNRVQLAEILDREDVQKQLIQLGVDPTAARARVEHMTDAEVAQLNGRIAGLPAGAGVSNTELLLIIIILILVL